MSAPGPRGPDTNGLRAAAELLRTPQVGAFLSGRAVAATGAWMERIAFGWLVWEATQSPAWVGVLAAARLLPGAVLGPLGGVLADRRGALAVLRTCHVAAALLSAAIAGLVAAGVANVWGLLLLAGASGAIQSLANGPMKAAVSEVSPRRLLATAIPVASVTFNAAAFLGPALAGGTIALAGSAPVFVGAALAAGCFATVLFRIEATRSPPRPRASHEATFSSALSEAVRDPVIGPHLALHVAFALLMRPIVEMLPAIAGGLRGGGPETLGLLTAASGAGAFVGSLWLTWRSAAGSAGLRVIGAASAACLAAFLLAAADGDGLAVVAIASLGAALVVRAAGGNIVVQLAVDDGHRGRVMAIWGTSLRLGSGIGGLAFGLAADVIGLERVLSIAAALAAFIVLIVSTRLRGRTSA